ncbi:hypothetical protein Ancab_036021 [Ancistrocladus abbreviatus]
MLCQLLMHAQHRYRCWFHGLQEFRLNKGSKWDHPRIFLQELVDAAMRETAEGECKVKLVAIPDGLEPEDNRKDERKLGASIFKVFPGYVSNLIQKANKLGSNDQITCVVADAIFGWALEIAEQARVELALFWTSSPASLAVTLQIPELIATEFIDSEGTPIREEKIQPLPDMPAMIASEMPWCSPTSGSFQMIIFEYSCMVEQILRRPKWLLCNWFHELATSASDVIPNVVAVGPLLANGQFAGTIRSEDTTCLSWLDQQPTRSVIYVAFGSISTLSRHQLTELALGLELAGQRFLWVARLGLTGASSVNFPNGFTARVAGHGKIVEWAPQEKVLAHPAVACFLTHCGWNSTMEGISMGVPFLCWPCFADQLYTRTCICDAWKIGLSLVPDKNMIISRLQIKWKIDELLTRVDIRKNSLKLQEAAIRSIVKGGSSFESTNGFIEQIKGWRWNV